ncbi:MAG TPA: hypothetical protein VF311_14630 [Terriglobales bacterium]
MEKTNLQGWGTRLQQAIWDDVRLTVYNQSDEKFAIAGATIECNGVSLGQIIRPAAGEQWLLPARGGLDLHWWQGSSVMVELVKIVGLGDQNVEAYIEFVFDVLVDGDPTEFRKKMKVIVQPRNYRAYPA